jgi:DNA/RNA endonuclease YhcR with UshA esterase domain
MRSGTPILLTAAALLFCGAPVRAHHSFAAEYDINKKVKLTGTVTKFDLTNPHSWIYIDVKDESGNVTNWGFETANPNSLYRRGYRKGLIAPGMVVTIEGYQAKDGSHTGNGHILTLPDGMVIQLGSETNPG